MLKEFNITVLGQARVGKTSLLSSIYYQFDEVISTDIDLEIRAVNEEDSLLGKPVRDMQKAFDTSTKMPLNNADVVPATRLGRKNGVTDIKYKFTLGQKNKKPKIQLVFRDYPGEQLLENQHEVVKRIRECDVTMIAVDTLALMMEDSKFDPLLLQKNQGLTDKNGNGSVGVLRIFQEAYKDLKSDKLILLVPTKCEKWTSDEASTTLLLDRLKLKYDPLLRFLNSDGPRDRVAIVVTPVETLGNIVYAYMSSKETYSPNFLKKSVFSKYAPKYCDQPLRYILRFTLKRFLENQGFWFDLLRRDKPFLNAINEFTKGCKTESGLEENANGFAVLQGGQLL
ncbi:hypothetical protein [Spirosoma fluviale]|uniref:Uncharacterized protein n=1 Tax=Spirosoma fluviale TaxID=1597977 RepID=A0A286GWG2_9BACT|nr:hypothetical protein [Spirosoma fluviale]SOD99394.1 hypothetical protein SAMN06269250_6401 [Spirosoma fluviale]